MLKDKFKLALSLVQLSPSLFGTFFNSLEPYAKQIDSDHPGLRKHKKTGEKWFFFFGFGPFLSLGWSESILVFCIFPGILRHKFRVSTRGTYRNFYLGPIKGPWLFWRALDGSYTTSKYNFWDRNAMFTW